MKTGSAVRLSGSQHAFAAALLVALSAAPARAAEPGAEELYRRAPRTTVPRGAGGMPPSVTDPTTSMDASADSGANAGCLAPAAYYRDADSDGFGRSDITRLFCASPGNAPHPR